MDAIELQYFPRRRFSNSALDIQNDLRRSPARSTRLFRKRSKSLSSIRRSTNVDHDVYKTKLTKRHSSPPAHMRSFQTTSKGIRNTGDRRESSGNPRRTSYATERKDSLPECAKNRDRGYSLPTKGQDAMFIDETFQKLLNVSGDEAKEESSSADRSPDEPGEEEGIPTYKVLVYGDHGVGKSALINQFTTSEFMGASEISTEDDDPESNTTAIAIILNEEEAIVELTEATEEAVLSEAESDAYIILYSCADRSTFKTATDSVKYYTKILGTEQTIFLVGNKIDLVRRKQVSKEEGCCIADTFGCKFAETSVALNHNVDELLVGVLSQIRMKMQDQVTGINSFSEFRLRQQQKGLRSALKTALWGVLRKRRRSSCENLLEL